MKSVVHTSVGLPFDPDTNRRVFLFTAWEPDAIRYALKKVREFDRQHVKIQRHLGTTGLTGPEWWSFTACLDVPRVKRSRFERMPLRYGFDRWVWTRDSETLSKW